MKPERAALTQFPQVTRGDSGLVPRLSKTELLEGGGIGIAVPRYLVESELETGDLIEVLPDWQIEPEVM